MKMGLMGQKVKAEFTSQTRANILSTGRAGVYRAGGAG